MNIKVVFLCVVLAISAAHAQEVFNPANVGTLPLTQEQANQRSNVVNYGFASTSAFDDNATGASGKNNFTSSI